MRCILGLIVGIAGVAGDLGAQRDVAMRFASMDRNRDGIIARAEWVGTERSFDRHDWNGDGILSGDEVRLGQSRPHSPANSDFDSPDREYVFADWTTRGFRGLDHNRDGRITRDEWHFDREGFRYVDHNDDGVISRAEFFSEQGEDDDRDDRFAFLDADQDRRISRTEWHGSRARFTALDADGDGYLTRAEVVGTSPPLDLFREVDVNRDGSISPAEWHWSGVSFDARDLDHNGRLSRREFEGTVDTPTTRSEAYRAGFERGRQEGQQAARDERAANRPWDLEGQRELEAADAGDLPGTGDRADYQTGYRDGFRRGYREGWTKTR
jgi:Ca2+-binding EF-hand superfamily protein